MKKLLLILLTTLFTVTSYAQELFHRTVTTTNASTNQMVWSYSDNKYIFIDNQDKMSFLAKWEFSFNDNGGSIISGNIFYTIKKYYTTKTEEGVDIVFITAYNHKIDRDIDVILGSPEGELFMAFYDYGALTAYYFW